MYSPPLTPVKRDETAGHRRLRYSHQMRWEPGDTVALREIWRGRIWTARAVTVVEDAEERLMFYVPPGMRWKCPLAADGHGWMRVPEDDWTLGDRVWEGKHVLSFAWPGVSHAVLAYWDADRSFLGWYINLQTPLVRTAIGFDYMDHMLDIEVEPDGSWRLKDEEDLDDWVRRGGISEAEARAIRLEARRAVARLGSGESPFDERWESWRPDPSWPAPELPAGWGIIAP